MITETVEIRHLIPSQGKAIKNTVTGDFYPEGIYLGKDENEANYIEVDSSEINTNEEAKM